VADVNPALEQEVLYVPRAEGKSQVQQDREVDDLG
jgi:hypothetical protein